MAASSTSLEPCSGSTPSLAQHHDEEDDEDEEDNHDGGHDHDSGHDHDGGDNSSGNDLYHVCSPL